MRYFLPQEVITTFLQHAINNYSPDGRNHIETLAFLVGRQDGDEVTATKIMFPQQQGTSSYVKDTGKRME